MLCSAGITRLDLLDSVMAESIATAAKSQASPLRHHYE